MSLAVVHSRALDGLQAPPVTVEVHLANGLPSFTLVGLADTEVKEARERVRAALQTSGLAFPHNKRITVNLAPADLPKESGRFDLPIALGILAASGQIDVARLAGNEYAGELSLAGDLRPVRGRHCDGRCAASRGLDAGPGVAPFQRRGGRPGARPANPRRIAPARGGSFAAAGRRGPRPSAAAGHAACQRQEQARRTFGARPARGQGPGRGQARARSRGGWRPQRADVRAPGHRQVDAGPAISGAAAASVGRRGTGIGGGDQPRQQPIRRRQLGPASLAQPPPQRLVGGPGGRWVATAAGRDLAGAPGGAVSRRAARVSEVGPGGLARAAGVRANRDLEGRAAAPSFQRASSCWPR